LFWAIELRHFDTGRESEAHHGATITESDAFDIKDAPE
jgi:hypothetical protein